VSAQIIALCEDRALAAALLDHIRKNNGDDDVICSMWDTDLWQNISNGRIESLREFASSAYNMRLQFGSDGVEAFSGRWGPPKSFWPVLLSILNLSAQVRNKPEYTLYLGSSVGKAPSNETYPVIMLPVLKWMNKVLFVEGIRVYNAWTKTHMVIRSIIYRTGQDGQGISKLHSRKQGGYCSCVWCVLRNVSVTGEDGQTFSVAGSARRSLTKDSTLYDMRQEITTDANGAPCLPWLTTELRPPPMLKTTKYLAAQMVRRRTCR
jgi:hypothetical protein